MSLSEKIKHDIVKSIFQDINEPVMLDTAGKYGAGLSLEMIGKILRQLNIDPNQVMISNKLGWYRVPLTTPEPTFEPGVWMDLEYDAVQKISYNGILDCWEQGCELIGNDYFPQFLSVHDPDEYVANGRDDVEKKERFHDVIDAYRALLELKAKGKAQAIGVGAKNWKVIREIIHSVDLDWVMLAISFTIFTHPIELMNFMDECANHGITIINSAVFNGGFLTGGQFFNYREMDPNDEKDKAIFKWRDRFFQLCVKYQVNPATACVQFGLSHPAVSSIALNTSKPERARQNRELLKSIIPDLFWRELKQEGLVDKDYPYLG